MEQQRPRHALLLSKLALVVATAGCQTVNFNESHDEPSTSIEGDTGSGISTESGSAPPANNTDSNGTPTNQGSDSTTGSAPGATDTQAPTASEGVETQETASRTEAPGTDTEGTDTTVRGTDTDIESPSDSASHTEAPTSSEIATATATATSTATVTSPSTDTVSATETESVMATETATDTGIIESGTLVHRWTFNNTLADAVGNSDAERIYSSGDGSDAALSADRITLAGGDSATYINLGSNLLSSVGGPVTIELWATQLSVSFYGRIFQFGSGNSEYLTMTWSYDDDVAGDIVQWIGSDNASVTDSNAPFTLNQEFHIVMTLEPGGGAGGDLRIGWYSALSSAANLGGEKDSMETSDILAGFDDSDGFLGMSHYAEDPRANASYNEVRIWSGLVSSTDLELLHDLGPDM